ncbi:hypothetical protein BH09DEP1_BH09DEP1_3290 [soil metagenome]
MQKNLSLSMKCSLSLITFILTFSLQGMDVAGRALPASHSDVKLQIVHALIKTSPNMPQAVKQIKKITYTDPKFAQTLNTISMSRIIQALAQKFYTRKYTHVANALMPKKFEGAANSTTLTHWGQLVRDWYQIYNQFTNSIYDMNLATAQNLFKQSALPSDEIADDLAEYFQQAKSVNDAFRKLSLTAKIAILAQVGPEHACSVTQALQYHVFSHLCAEGQDRDGIKKAIKAANNVNYYDKDGQTALYDSIFFDSPMGVEELLLAGADPNQKDFEGKTALMVAVDRANGSSPEIVKKLITAGADISLRDPLHNTPLQNAKALQFHCAPEHIRKNRELVVNLLQKASQK